MPPRPPVSEIALSRAWNEGAGGSRLTTTAGDAVEIVYRGSWSHGLGPDFPGAMLLFPGHRLLTGAIEIHLTTSGWRAHGHHLDPAYNDVILHVVGEDDGAETRRADGALVPVVAIGFEAARGANAALPWHLVGGAVCAAEEAARRTDRLAGALQGLGDRRLAAKSAEMEARLTDLPPGEVLWSGLLDALGYTVNRAPMQEVAHRLPLHAVESLLSGGSPDERPARAAALLLGVAGFLPLAPRDAAHAGLTTAQTCAIEATWGVLATTWASEAMPPTAWSVTRVRPANHPVARLATAAGLLAAAEAGLTSALLDPVRSGNNPVQALIARTGAFGPRLGEDRALAIVANVLLPFGLALAEQTGDAALLAAASAAWERLPASGHNDVTRRALIQVTGGAPLRHLGERGMQGLIHLDRALCTPRRCYECPVAAIILAPDAEEPPEPVRSS